MDSNNDDDDDDELVDIVVDDDNRDDADSKFIASIMIRFVATSRPILVQSDTMGDNNDDVDDDESIKMKLDHTKPT
jgi:hypothetical protein